MRTITYLLLPAFMLCGQALADGNSPSPFDGKWKSESFGCYGLKDADQTQCAKEPPEFVLNLWSSRQRLCGSYVASVGSREDDDDGKPMTGTIHGDVATLTFQSSRGPTFTVNLMISHGKLHWQVVKKHEAGPAAGYTGDTLLPDSDVFDRSSAVAGTNFECEKF